MQEAHGSEAAQVAADLERAAERASELLRTRESLDDKIRGVGVLPGDALARHEASSAAALQKALKKVAKSLGKFDKVNLKASEQLGSFQEEQARLQGRRKVCLLVTGLPSYGSWAFQEVQARLQGRRKVQDAITKLMATVDNRVQDLTEVFDHRGI